MIVLEARMRVGEMYQARVPQWQEGTSNHNDYNRPVDYVHTQIFWFWKFILHICIWHYTIFSKFDQIKSFSCLCFNANKIVKISKFVSYNHCQLFLSLSLVAS